MMDLKRVRYIAANYRGLQGLRMLPWFLWMLALCAINPLTGLPQGRFDYQLLIVVPGIVVPWLLSRWIGSYYDRTFGRVVSLKRGTSVEWLAGAAAVIVAYVGFFVDSMQRLPLSVTGLIIAATMFVGWWMSGRFSLHSAILAALLAGISLLPLTGIPSGGHWMRLFGGFGLPILLAVFLSVNSVVSHLVLVRNLQPGPKENSDGNV